MNSLEKEILKAASECNEMYFALSGGHGIYHAPESVIHALIAINMIHLGNAIYIDTSLKKIRQDMPLASGRIPKNIRTRPDLIVWNKSTATIRAAIEVKRAWTITPISKDVDKLRMHMRHANSAKSGYILVYTDFVGAKRLEKLPKKLIRWKNDLGINLIGQIVKDEKEYEVCWCFALYKV
jgi:hypothetical protein